MSDNTKIEISKVWKSIFSKYNIRFSTTKPYCQDQNRCERLIQELKKITIRLMDQTNNADYLWYEVLQHTSTLQNHISKPILQNKTPIEKLFGVTPDISVLH